MNEIVETFREIIITIMALVCIMSVFKFELTIERNGKKTKITNKVKGDK